MKSYPPSENVDEGTRTITHRQILGSNGRSYRLEAGEEIEVVKLNKVYRTAEIRIQGEIETLAYSMITRISK